jgi:4-hydroxybenzoyl-CoA thioesterase/acyl-CoA thioester hydrolase
MTWPFQTSRRIEFRDTDAAGIAHFSTYFLFMEEAEHELLRQAGLTVFQPEQEGTLTWPRVSAKCEYRSAARFEELLTIEGGIARLGTKSVTWRFRISRDGTELALGELAAVCCRLHPGRAPESLPIPQAIRDKLARYCLS